MGRAWKCARCGTGHSQNPAECRSCGHGIFEPITESELAEMSNGVDSPDSMDLSGRAAPASKEPSVESGPDVAPDGSLVRDEKQDTNEEEPSLLARVRSRLPL